MHQSSVLGVRQWLAGLADALDRSQCRIDGLGASYEDAGRAVKDLFRGTRKAGRTVWWVGNGGSSAICSHLAQDAMNKLKVKSLPLSDASLLTCMANDFGYPEIYARPLAQLLEKGDMVIAISSSGKSENILRVAALAAERGANLVTLSAFKPDNPLFAAPARVSFYLPCDLYGHAEVGHEALIHAIIETASLEELPKAAE